MLDSFGIYIYSGAA